MWLLNAIQTPFGYLSHLLVVAQAGPRCMSLEPAMRKRKEVNMEHRRILDVVSGESLSTYSLIMSDMACIMQLISTPVRTQVMPKSMDEALGGGQRKDESHKETIPWGGWENYQSMLLGWIYLIWFFNLEILGATAGATAHEALQTSSVHSFYAHLYWTAAESMPTKPLVLF